MLLPQGAGSKVSVQSYTWEPRLSWKLPPKFSSIPPLSHPASGYPSQGVPKQLESKLVPGEGCLITAEERGTEGQGEGKE